jgi:Trypsin
LLHAHIWSIAAHCNINLTNAFAGPDQVNLSIVSGTIHPFYAEANTDFDFMVLKLVSPVEGVPTIGLNNQSERPDPGDQLQVVGLGVTSEEGEESEVLQEVTVDYIENSICNEMYVGQVTDAML